MFDIDWTIIKPCNGRTFPKDRYDWQWLNDSVKNSIQNYEKLGYTIAMISNQSKIWKCIMIDNIIDSLELSNKPIKIISMDKKTHKPNIQLFNIIIGKNNYDKENSFMCGDALGRVGDHDSCDKDVANNLGIKYYSPEELFPIEQKLLKYNVEEISKLEVIILVGYQGSGKSTICNQFPNYHVISGDILKTPTKMIKEASKYINEKSIIFDATNGTIERRKLYIDFANTNNRTVRCIWIDTTIDKAIERIQIRENNGGSHVPKIALYKFRKSFVIPDVNEGFELIRIDNTL